MHNANIIIPVLGDNRFKLATTLENSFFMFSFMRLNIIALPLKVCKDNYYIVIIQKNYLSSQYCELY